METNNSCNVFTLFQCDLSMANMACWSTHRRQYRICFQVFGFLTQRWMCGIIRGPAFFSRKNGNWHILPFVTVTGDVGTSCRILLSKYLTQQKARLQYSHDKKNTHDMKKTWLANFPNNISVVFLWTVLQALASYLPFFFGSSVFFSSFGIFPRKQAEEKRTQLQPTRLSWPFFKSYLNLQGGPRHQL